MMSFMNTMCALGCFVTGGKKGDINPRSRARNSRLRESQGWPLDHSLFFFLSLSLSLQQSPIILWNFTISNLCPAFSANYISTPQREMFKLTKIIPFKLLTTHWSKRYTCTCTNILSPMENLGVYLQLWIQERWPHSEDAYKTEFLSMNSFSPLPQTSKWIDGGKMLGGKVFTRNHGSPCLQRNFVHLPV